MLVIQGKDPSAFLDGVRALLVTHCFLLSDPGRELWRNPFGRGLSPCRRNTSCSTCLMFLPFGLSLLSDLPFSLPFSLPLPLFFPFAFHERVNFHWCGVVPVRYASLSVRLMHRFPLTSESIVPLQPRRVESNVPPPFWILWVVCQYCCFDRVLKRV